MRYKPIEKPRLVGCLTCSPIPPAVLPKRFRWHIYGYVQLEVDDKVVCEWNDDTPMLQTIERRYAERIAAGQCVLLKVNTPLRGETYERSSEDGEWYLVKQEISDW